MRHQSSHIYFSHCYSLCHICIIMENFLYSYQYQSNNLSARIYLPNNSINPSSDFNRIINIFSKKIINFKNSLSKSIIKSHYIQEDSFFEKAPARETQFTFDRRKFNCRCNIIIKFFSQKAILFRFHMSKLENQIYNFNMYLYVSSCIIRQSALTLICLMSSSTKVNFFENATTSQRNDISDWFERLMDETILNIRSAT